MRNAKLAFPVNNLLALGAANIAGGVNQFRSAHATRFGGVLRRWNNPMHILFAPLTTLLIALAFALPMILAFVLLLIEIIESTKRTAMYFVRMTVRSQIQTRDTV